MTQPARFRLSIKGPPIHLESLLFGHGWIFLAPHRASENRDTLERPLTLASGNRVDLRVSYASQVNVQGTSARPLSSADRSEVRRACRTMLRLDEDLSEFHRLCAGDPVLRKVARRSCGRLLRSPTVFEDVVKTICTTNCSWGNTKLMVTRLCELGDGHFPSPEALAECTARQLKLLRAGYRAAYLAEFAQRVASGTLDPESWRADPGGENTLAEIRSIKGVGNYAAGHILMLLGRYDTIPLDSESRTWIRKTYFRGRKASDKQLLARYEPHGRWKFLAYKFDRIARRENYIN